MIACEREVLGRVDRRDARRSAGVSASSSGTMPPTTTGASTPAARSPSTTRGTRARCEPERIEMPTTSTSSSRAAATISSGDEPDALVDDLEAGVARGDGDLLGAVGVAVEAGLGHEEPRRRRRGLARTAARRARRGRRTAVAARWPRRRARRWARGTRRRPSRRASAHSPVVPPAWASAMVGDHDVVRRLGAARHAGELVERRARPRIVALRAPRDDVGDQLALDGGVDRQDGPDRRVARERRRRGLGEAVDAHHDLLAGLDARHALGLAARRGGSSARRWRRRRRRGRARRRARPARPERQLAHLGVHDLRAGEDVGVLEQVGLEGEDLLDRAGSTAGPRVAAVRAPRSTPAAGWPGRARRRTG